MKTTVKAFLLWKKYEWEDKPSYILESSDLSAISPAHVVVREVEVDVEIPDDFDPRPKQIAALKEKQTELRAEFQTAMNNIEEQIQRLQCLEFQHD